MAEFFGTNVDEWRRIYADPKVRAGVPSAPDPPHQTPLVREPTCPAHCSHHHVEGQMVCRHCGGIAYNVVAHEWPWTEGHYWYSLEPRNGAPPHRKGTPECCGQPMRRVWPTS